MSAVDISHVNLIKDIIYANFFSLVEKKLTVVKDLYIFLFV